MGAPKQKWKSEEEEALRRGVLKHGPGKWRTIQKDPEFSPFLSSRSNIDLKDKWRNLSFSGSVLGSRERIRTPRIKSNSPTQSSTPEPQGVLLLSAPQKVVGTSTPGVTPSQSSQDGEKTPPRYGAMIMEALAEIKEPHGAELGAIFNFIEQKHEVPPNFRRLLGSKLRRLLQQNKVEKINKGYRLRDPNAATKTQLPKQKDPSSRQKDLSSRPKALQNSGTFAGPMEEKAMAAAYKIADAEAKSFLASEAIKEAERISKMAEEADSLLMLAKEISERCSRGELVTISQAA